MNTCKKCHGEFQGNYCPDCGYPQKIERIDRRYILTEIADVLNFQKGFLYTVKELLIRPGHSIRVFLNEDRKRLVRPIMFILVTSLIYTIIIKIFHFDDGVIDGARAALDGTNMATFTIVEWIQENYGYANIIMAFFIGLWLKLFFSKYPYNFFEILVLLCFIMGIGMLIYSVFDIFRGFTHANIMMVQILAGFIYTTFAVGQFFDKKKIWNYVLGLVSYLLGMFTFFFVAMGIGVIIDLAR